MKNRLLALLLCLCLLAPCGLAEEAQTGTYLSDNEVTHSDFTLDLSLHADAFPESKAHPADWEAFLSKLRLKGSIDVLDFLQTYSRVFLDGNLMLNGKEQLDFVYDGYHSYRFFLSPALRNDSVHFQMNNFLEFMLKPYYYMELPTQYLALALYPEASYTLGHAYYAPILETLAKAEPEGAATRVVSYADLYELAETLDLLVNEDEDNRVYFYLTCLLGALYASDTTQDALSYLEGWLDYLDPEQNGLTIAETADGVTLTLGETVVFAKTTAADGASAFTLTLPDANGYLLTLDYAWTPGTVGATLAATLRVTLEGDERILLKASGDGLPLATDLSGEGTFTVAASGSALDSELPALSFAFDWVRDGLERPYTLDLSLDWLHPQTGLAALSAHFRGSIATVDKSVFIEVDYPQNDFFTLNEGILEEYKQKYLASLALAALPFLLETPAGVVDDVTRFLAENDLLLALGIE